MTGVLTFTGAAAAAALLFILWPRSESERATLIGRLLGRYAPERVDSDRRRRE